MIREALEWFKTLVVSGQIPDVIDREDIPDLPARTVLIREGVSYQERTFDPPKRRYKTGSVTDLERAIEHWRDALRHTAVLISETRIEAILDEDSGRDERLCFPLSFTPEWDRLIQCERQRDGMTQRAFVQMLRVDLTRAVGMDVIEQFRALKFKQSTEGEARVDQGSEAIGQSVKRAVSLGDQDVPEYVNLNLRIFRELDVTASVECVVDLDLESVAFRLIPVAGALEDAKREVLSSVRNNLAERLGDEVFVIVGAAT